MYYPLELNEQLTNAIEAAVASKFALSVFARNEESQTIERISMHHIEELDEILCDVINRIAYLMSGVLADAAVKGYEEHVATSKENDC